MYLSDSFCKRLACVNDADWQRALDRHPFWRPGPPRIEDVFPDAKFHVLMHEGSSAEGLMRSHPAFELDAVPVPADVFEDSGVTRLAEHWSDMHANRYGEGVTTRMGLYVVRAGATLGFRVDGPVLQRGSRVDFAPAPMQRALVEVHASHRTLLPLRLNAEDRFMICGHRAPLGRGELCEFCNVVPHAYFNRGREHAVLLVTTYLDESLLPPDYWLADAVAA